MRARRGAHAAGIHGNLRPWRRTSSCSAGSNIGPPQPRSRCRSYGNCSKKQASGRCERTSRAAMSCSRADSAPDRLARDCEQLIADRFGSRHRSSGALAGRARCRREAQSARFGRRRPEALSGDVLASKLDVVHKLKPHRRAGAVRRRRPRGLPGTRQASPDRSSGAARRQGSRRDGTSRNWTTVTNLRRSRLGGYALRFDVIGRACGVAQAERFVRIRRGQRLRQAGAGKRAASGPPSVRASISASSSRP